MFLVRSNPTYWPMCWSFLQERGDSYAASPQAVRVVDVRSRRAELAPALRKHRSSLCSGRASGVLLLWRRGCGNPACQGIAECNPMQGCQEVAPNEWECPVVGNVENEPWCCGSGVDCVCPGQPLLNSDRHCAGGFSYCRCHDTFCRDWGWFFCLTSGWLACLAGCGGAY